MLTEEKVREWHKIWLKKCEDIYDIDYFIRIGKEKKFVEKNWLEEARARYEKCIEKINDDDVVRPSYHLERVKYAYEKAIFELLDKDKGELK